MANLPVHTDRTRLVDLALANDWTVSDFRGGYTELTRVARPKITLWWNVTDGSLDYLETATFQLTDVHDVQEFLSGHRYKHDDETARYFTITCPADAELANYAINESDQGFRPVRPNRLSGLEHEIILDIAKDARALGRVMGSHRATNTQTVFGTELHVTWKREV